MFYLPKSALDNTKMTIYQHILGNLLKHSWMRYDRHGAIKEMLKEKYDVVGWENLPDVAHDWLSYDRVFRLVQSENENIRPHDWETQKKVREQNFEMKTLHREPGFHSLNKKVKEEVFEFD